MRYTTTALLLTATLALTGCNSSSSDDGAPAETSPTTASATPTAATSPDPADPADPAEAAQQCSTAIAEAAPAWDDWNYSPGDWQNDPRTPSVCLNLADEENPPRGNRAFMDALIDGLENADDPRARQ